MAVSKIMQEIVEEVTLVVARVVSILGKAGPVILGGLAIMGFLQVVQTVWGHAKKILPEPRNLDSSDGEIEPRPKWWVLQWLNIAVAVVFVCTICFVVFVYGRELAENGRGSGPFSITLFLPLLVVWSACLAYFFGFFGISFLDTDDMYRSPSSFGLGELSRHVEHLDEERRLRTSFSGSKMESCFEDFQQGSPVNISYQQYSSPSSSPSKKLAAPTHSAVREPEGFVKKISFEVESVPENLTALSDEELLEFLKDGRLKDHQLEHKLGNDPWQRERAVRLRRKNLEMLAGHCLDKLPFQDFEYDQVIGMNCENIIGFIKVPCGVAGPLMLDGDMVYVPMATTEGALLASTNRGCKAIAAGQKGCQTAILKDGITRAPVVRLPSAMEAAAVYYWINNTDNFQLISSAFNSTTRYGELQSLRATVAGRNVHIRCICHSGDAMGMNMVSKGCLKIMDLLKERFPELEVIAISGNTCTDKKPSAINWIEGRGKSLIAEAVIPGSAVQSILKTSVQAIVQTNIQKNLVGSAMAGSIGGFNAHASNIVTAIFLAAGQDPAQNVESSNCLTLMEAINDGKDLHVSVTMPSIEVGTVGGGTGLPSQAACLRLMHCQGSSKSGSPPGSNARRLASIVAGTVLAGELSLVAALAANHLVRSHMQHNRKKI